MIFFSACQNSNKEKITLNDFPQKKFKKVITYEMSGEDGHIIENEKLSKDLIITEKRLSEKEANTLLDILLDDATYGDVAAKCFEPRLGYVFYSENNEVAAHATVCLACNQIRTSPDIGVFILSERGKKRLRELKETVE